jgi:hypothetical protein
MDSLYSEMSHAIEAEIMAIVDTPFEAKDWKGRVLELIPRRSMVFERITPFKRASESTAHRSKFLEAANTRFVAALREILLRELPAKVAADKPMVEALDLLLGFEAWARLRRDQALTAPQAREVLAKAVGKLLG